MLCENVNLSPYTLNDLTLIKIIFNIAIKCIWYEWWNTETLNIVHVHGTITIQLQEA